MHLLVLMKGHPGSGKSTLARLLAELTKWPLVDKDDCRDALSGWAADGDCNAVSYAIMFQVAATQLSLGISTIIDCPLARVDLYHSAAALAAKHKAAVVLLECAPSCHTTWRQRLEARGAAIRGTPQAHKPCTWDALQQLLERYQGCWRWSDASSQEGKGVKVLHRVVLDTSATTPAEQLHTVVQYLAAHRLAHVACTQA